MVLRDQLPEYAEEFVSFAEKGYRVLVFGVYDGILEEPVLTEAVTPLGYILIANPIRKEARATFDYFKKQQVAIKVISGDNPLTVFNVAVKQGFHMLISTLMHLNYQKKNMKQLSKNIQFLDASSQNKRKSSFNC